MFMFKKSFILTIVFSLLICMTSLTLGAQEMPPGDDTPETREKLHLNTIGTYSAGFVLQAYGYIGVLADVLSRKVYEPERVRSMLGESTSFLNNARQQLALYHDGNIQLSAGDQAFIDGISSIIKDLIDEAEALSSFSQSLDQADLVKFEKARNNAWSGIKKYLGVK